MLKQKNTHKKKLKMIQSKIRQAGEGGGSQPVTLCLIN